MRYLSICSGIEAATVAWHPLGWTPAAFSEIEVFPRAVLKHHYPDVPCHGDFTTIGADEYGPIELLVGGTPCQSFSVAGLRGGMADERGQLALKFLRLLDRTRARWMVWENVPGVLSSSGGRDFGSFLGGLVELGYGFAYRVLDAQHFGVPQRRRRVFVVGHLGDWRRAAAVLFERHSLSGHPAPRRGSSEEPGSRVARSVAIRGRDGTPQAELGDEVANAVLTPNGGRGGVGVGAALVEAIGFNARQDVDHWAERSRPVDTDAYTQAVALQSVNCPRQRKQNGIGIGDDGAMYSLTSRDLHGVAITPIDMRQASRGATMTNNRPEGRIGGAPGTGIGQPGDPSFTVATSHVPAIVESVVRRLTPRECERLQGFPDDYTAVLYRGKPASDGPRYNALGNSMAVPVMRWIGERIAAVDVIQAAVSEAA